MASQLRMEYAGAITHVMSGGYRKEAIFVNEEDRRRFLRTLGDVCERAGWGRHAYCPRSDHFHVVVETPKPTLVIGMKWFGGTYTQRFNARHRMRRHLIHRLSGKPCGQQAQKATIRETDPFLMIPRKVLPRIYKNIYENALAFIVAPAVGVDRVLFDWFFPIRVQFKPNR